MKTFTIDAENNIIAHATAQEADAVTNANQFIDETGFAGLAAAWPAGRLLEIWNSIPGVTEVTKFKDRKTAVARIWKTIQSLGGTELAEATENQEISVVDEVPAEAEAQTVETEPQPETPFDNPATPVEPQTGDVAPEEPTAKNKANRAKRTPKEATGAPRESSKTSQLIAMLKLEGGTTLEDIMTAMGWQKHTTRAMLSAGGSLTKNHGLVIVSEKVGDHRKYSIKA